VPETDLLPARDPERELRVEEEEERAGEAETDRPSPRDAECCCCDVAGAPPESDPRLDPVALPAREDDEAAFPFVVAASGENTWRRMSVGLPAVRMEDVTGVRCVGTCPKPAADTELLSRCCCCGVDAPDAEAERARDE